MKLPSALAAGGLALPSGWGRFRWGAGARAVPGVSGPAGRAKPEELLFGRLRRNLALMYAGVLAAMLAAMAVALYLALRQELLQTVADRALGRAQFHAASWGEGRQGPCSPPVQGGPGTPPARPPTEGQMWAVCYDAAGTVFRANAEPPVPGVAAPVAEAIRAPGLAARALRDGAAGDIVDAGPGFGVVTRQAAVARSGAGQPLGVVLIAQPVTEQLETLSLVRNLLLGLGGLVLLLATAGGWLLAKRALGPARLAFARQQAFISDASHEFRTPLTLMRANAELLLRHRDRMPEEDAEVLDEIVSETEHMSRLANDLLTLARLDAGKLELEREIVDLSDVAGDLVRRVGALAEERSIALRDAGDGGGRPLVYADPQYTHEAGLILVENAVKYTPSGGTVTVRTETHGGQASLVVEDTGVGIPKEHLNRLGERFFRADASRNRATGGTGLGLAIAFRIARAHGGAIQMESEPGKGTRAALSLPAASV